MDSTIEQLEEEFLSLLNKYGCALKIKLVAPVGQDMQIDIMPSLLQQGVIPKIEFVKDQEITLTQDILSQEKDDI